MELLLSSKQNVSILEKMIDEYKFFVNNKPRYFI